MNGLGYSASLRTPLGSNQALDEHSHESSSLNDRDRNFDADAELVRLAQSGRHKAFELLVVKYQRRIAALIQALVRNDSIAEELCQETFLRAFRALPELRAEVAFYAWIQAIARNLASGYLRSSARNPIRSDERGFAASDDADSAEIELGRANVLSVTPEDELGAKQLFAGLEKAIASLPKRQRDALLMREIDGLDYQAIAVTMALPLNSVKSLIYRAREAVAAQLAPFLDPVRDRRW